MIVIGAVGLVLLFALARRFELADRPDRWVAIVLAVLLVESLVHPDQADVPAGPFRIPVLGGGLRTHDLLVAVGLVARATVRPFPTRLRLDGTLWFVAGVWFVTAAARGLLIGNSSNIVFFSLGSVVGLFGGALLAAGCDARRLAELFRRAYVVPLGLLVLVMLPNEAGDEPVELLGTGLGTISVDTASVFVSLGIAVVLVEWASPRRDAWTAWAAVPLLVTPFVLEQRATLLHLGVAALVVGWAVVRVEWSSVFHVRRVQLVKGAIVVVAVLMGVLMVSLAGDDGSVPLAGYYEETFASEGQQLSAQARRESFRVGVDEFTDRPVFGHGLGHTYTIVRPGATDPVDPATFDNVPLDVLVRTGLVGFVLFWGAMLLTLVEGGRTWRRHPDRTVAALALAGTAVLAGLAVKSGFESILEKGKLALVWGIAAGTVVAAARSLDRPSDRSAITPRSNKMGVTPWT